MVKKFIALFVLAFSMTASLFGAGFSGTVITIGPDLYADGTPVVKGEQYGVIYVPNGQTLSGLYSDGTLVDPVHNQLLQKKMLATAESRLRTSVSFGAEYANGTAYVVLFDTRKPDGTVGGLTNGWGLVAYAKLGNAPLMTSSIDFYAYHTYEVEEGGEVIDVPYAFVTTPTLLPPAVTSGLQISGIEVTDTEVLLTVDKSASCAYYLISASERLGEEANFVRQDKASAVRGSDDPAQPLVLRYPKSAAGRFFKVVAGTLDDL